MQISDELKNSIKNKSDQDLEKMLFEMDLWNPDVLLEVESELKQRNRFPADYAERLNILIEAEDKELSNGRPASLVGQILACITVFGLAGIYFGWSYNNSKVISKYTGKEYYKYNPKTREFGNYIFVISTIIALYGIFSRLV
jgi:hypothetical protein